MGQNSLPQKLGSQNISIGPRVPALIRGRALRCEEKRRDIDGRVLARCEVSGIDLGAALVREGMAWAYGRYGTDYIEQEEAARRKGLGVHAHPCTPAWQWRAQGRLQANSAPGLPSQDGEPTRVSTGAGG